ncbi:ABC transporter ATP-binding protein [Roseivivax sp. GX 12232]|uniref:ABC transporter ATP-binding protein n=1 Tax=Roseivivax sp. GX 12232 TaxID=2900547 RepID=UPI001E61BAFB|nr:ABC transporter ATP-binding protein [Roseivivax sp. GX 12232]MCE0505899.1 ABC transporter ATP-binding protein [Roseivivax sp. GX 12232]
MLPDPAPLFELSRASAGYGRSLVFEDLDLTLPAGCVIALCGPNGSGKSTALRSMRRLLPMTGGRILLSGHDLKDWTAKTLARTVAMLAQSPDAPEEMSVRDLVMLGRYAHRRPLSGATAADDRACAEALEATGMTSHAASAIGALSGGQAQRAWIAMVLAQEAPTILLDEPTNHLDIAHALDVLELIRRMNREQGRNVVVVLHDLNFAARYADHVVLFEEGAVAAQGSVPEVLTEATISRVFGVDCRVLHPEGHARPIIVALPRG